MLVHYVSTCGFIAGNEIRGRRLHVTRRVVAGDDVVSTGAVRGDSHTDLGGRGPDNLSCECRSSQYTWFKRISIEWANNVL